jgi:hypothetical protein
MNQTSSKQVYEPPTLEQHAWTALTGVNLSIGANAIPGNPLEMNLEGLPWEN